MPFKISRPSKRRVHSRLHLLSMPELRFLMAAILIICVGLISTIANPIQTTIAVVLITSYVTIAVLILRALPDLLGFLRSRLWLSILLGEVLFLVITIPANAAIFDTAEKYTTDLFGQYIDSSMIRLIFGFLRISSFILGAAFVMLALEKARHGENWQPFAWNSFAVLMVVVLVEGMSTLFLSSTTATPRPSPSPTTP